MTDHRTNFAALSRSQSVRRVAVMVMVVVFGLLLWAKLLLVTNHPRTAVADPEVNRSPVTAPAAPAHAQVHAAEHSADPR